MLKWLFKSGFRTQFFYLNLAIYALALVLTTIYCYARLDFVRSGSHPTKQVK